MAARPGPPEARGATQREEAAGGTGRCRRTRRMAISYEGVVRTRRMAGNLWDHEG